MMHNNLALFDTPSAVKSVLDIPQVTYGKAKKRRSARPSALSRIPRETNIGVAYVGANLQSLPLTRQGEEIAAVLEAKKKDGTPLYREVVAIMARRSTKTTSIWNVIIGRCATRPNYKVVTTAQDGIRARNRFREVQRALDRADFDGHNDPANRLGKLRWANGDEAIEFDNGSRIWVVPPEAGAFRGEAADCILFDEVGEYSPAKSDDLRSGALPLMDTRPDGQVIFTGTPGTSRTGLLWEKFQAALAPKSKLGIVGYFARDHETTFSYESDGSYTLNTKLLKQCHPGIGTVTTLQTIVDRAESMPPAQFEREYFCRFPFDNATSAIPESLWNDAASLDPLPTRPTRVGLGFDVAPDSSSAALVAAWRDENERAHIEVLAADWGTQWLALAVKNAVRKYRTPAGFDSIGANMDTADRLTKMRVATAPMFVKPMEGAAARLVQLLTEHNLTHYSQDDLTKAALGAAWRNVGDSGRLFARKQSAADVTPLVAASVALWQFDQLSKKRTNNIIFVEGNA